MSSLPDGGMHREAQALPLSGMARNKAGDIPESFRMWEQKARTPKKERKWQRGIVAHPLSESQWNRGDFSVTKWEFEKNRS